MIQGLPLFALLLATQSVAEPNAGTAFGEGVWRGTIGTYPVSLCTTTDHDGSLRALYFYHSTMLTIRLEPMPDGSWVEHAEGGVSNTGTWHAVLRGSDRIEGDWAGAARRLPVRLERISFTDEDGMSACGSREFLAPRIRPARLVRQPKQLGDIRYTGLSWDVGPGFRDVYLESFEIPEQRPGDAAINQAVRLDPDNPQGRGEYLSCLRTPLALAWDDGEYTVIYEPLHVNRNYVSAKVFNGGSCGGAHPYHGYGYQVWDRDSGQEIRLYRWFLPEAFETVQYAGDNEPYFKATPAFARLVSSYLRFEDNECRDLVQETEFWEVGLTARGMIFTPGLPHALMACGDDAVIPYRDLARWLNREGRAGVARARGLP